MVEANRSMSRKSQIGCYCLYIRNKSGDLVSKDRERDRERDREGGRNRETGRQPDGGRPDRQREGHGAGGALSEVRSGRQQPDFSDVPGTSLWLLRGS